jgi:hypothetical protein
MSGYEYYEDFISECDDLSLDNGVVGNKSRLSGYNRGRIQNAVADYKTDNKYVVLTREHPIIKGKKLKIPCFASGDVGSSIRNAITGQRYIDCKVGSAKEDMFCKVMICTGEFGPDPVTLFFDDMDSYMRHLITGPATMKSSRDSDRMNDRLKFC